MSDILRPGEVQISLDGEDVILKPSARALMTLEKKYDGLVGVVEGLTRFRSQAFVDVITAGTNAKPSEREQIPEAVYKTGIVDLLAPLTRFVNVLGNGGRPPKGEEDEPEQTDADSPNE